METPILKIFIAIDFLTDTMDKKDLEHVKNLIEKKIIIKNKQNV